MIIRLTFAVGIAAITVACSKQNPPSARQARTQSPPAPRDGGPPGRAATPTDTSLGALLARLPQLDGEFEEAFTLGAFVGDKATIEAIMDRGDSAVVRLVSCMDRTDSVRVQWQGHPLTLGKLCYAVLTNMAYYESYDDPAWTKNHPRYSSWPGQVKPNATEADMARAKRAWEEVLRGGAYHLL